MRPCVQALHLQGVTEVLQPVLRVLLARTAGDRHPANWQVHHLWLSTAGAVLLPPHCRWLATAWRPLRRRRLLRVMLAATLSAASLATTGL
jgi:hypothetical protein